MNEVDAVDRGDLPAHLLNFEETSLAHVHREVVVRLEEAEIGAVSLERFPDVPTSSRELPHDLA